MLLLLGFTAFLFSPCFSTLVRNHGPVIGLMAQDVRRPKANETSYIAASYVKTLESAGARVIPIMINRPEEYRKLFNSINGFFLPGGAANIMDSGYATAARIFYDLAIELAVLTSQERVLVRTNTTRVSLPLNFTNEANGSKLFKDFSPEMMEALATEPMTINAHKWSVSIETYHENEHLNKFYKVLSTNTDGIIEFISTFEAYDYPFYGVQWHPENNPYEWTRDFYVHTPISIRMTFYFADFFVNEARKSKHTFESEKAVRDLLIYHFHPNYTGETTSVFEQKYFYYDLELKDVQPHDEAEDEEAEDGVAEPKPQTDPRAEDIFVVSGSGVQTLAELNVVLVATVLAGILRGEM